MQQVTEMMSFFRIIIVLCKIEHKDMNLVHGTKVDIMKNSMFEIHISQPIFMSQPHLFKKFDNTRGTKERLVECGVEREQGL